MRNKVKSQKTNYTFKVVLYLFIFIPDYYLHLVFGDMRSLRYNSK